MNAQDVPGACVAAGPSAIAFCPWARPKWISALAAGQAAALVAAKDSWLSHPAVLARETSLTMAIHSPPPEGCQQGDLCELIADGSVALSPRDATSWPTILLA